MTNLKDGFRFLAEGGLNLVSVLDVSKLQNRTKHQIAEAGIPLTDYSRLVLVGHGGRHMWEKLQQSESGIRSPNPVDDYSKSLADRFIRDCLDASPVLWLYPDTSYLIPLQQLGEAAGWSFPSPLGTGISPVFGVWFAYRAAFLTNAELAPTPPVAATSPCDTCVFKPVSGKPISGKPCIDACPVGAVRTDAFDSHCCAGHRLSPGSPCADRCLARMACPMFPQHRYGLPQIQYHYRHSLETIASWTDSA